MINLSQQTETSDLLGNFKPVDIKSQMKMMKENFMDLFAKSFSLDENRSFLNHINVDLYSRILKFVFIIEILFILIEFLFGKQLESFNAAPVACHYFSLSKIQKRF